MSLKIELRHGDDNNVRICLAGMLDTLTAPMLDDRFDEIADADYQFLIIDLANLSYISSAGLRVIFKIAKHSKLRGVRVVIANRQPQVAKVFDIVKALPDVSVFANDAELDAYLGAMQKRVLGGDD